MKIKWLFSFFLFNSVAFANLSNEFLTAQLFERLKFNRTFLSEFLKKMPKGGDLHIHQTGAVLPEKLLNIAHSDDLCINRNTYKVYQHDQCHKTNKLNELVQDPNFHHAVIDAWSMHHFDEKIESGHDHFFNAFSKFSHITENHRPDVMSEILQHAAEQNEIYLELMTTTNRGAADKLAKMVRWHENFALLRTQLLALPLTNKLLDKISQDLSADEAQMRRNLACGTKKEQLGCQMKVNYIHQVLRARIPHHVFTQLLLGFEAAKRDKRIVAVNLVQPEDHAIAMRDYQLHMRMIKFFREWYPEVKVSLHAGELSDAIVSQNELKTHINDAIYVAGPDRIGHGADILFEDDAQQLMTTMAKKKILVEINLTSNHYILKLHGNKHPLSSYLQYGVPITLSTDDEGITRSSLTDEYQRAVHFYQLDYYTLKSFARNSIAYAFLRGESLWVDEHYKTKIAACVKDNFETKNLSTTCLNFLNRNEKANLQWQLEKQFTNFERNIVSKYPI